jgi:hypothetical protein
MGRELREERVAEEGEEFAASPLKGGGIREWTRRERRRTSPLVEES